MKLYFFPKKNPTAEEKKEGFKILAMWFVGTCYFLAAMYVDTYYARGTFKWFVFLALWMPLRWQNHVRSELRKESWADKNVIHT